MNTPIHPLISRLKRFIGLRMGCYDIHRLLFDYAEGTLEPELQRELERHFKDCKPCMDYLVGYRRTIAATHECCQHSKDLPPELRAKLEQFLREKL